MTVTYAITISGKVYRIYNYTETRFGKTFWKAELRTGYFRGKGMFADSTFISSDSIIEFWDDDDLKDM